MSTLLVGAEDRPNFAPIYYTVHSHSCTDRCKYTATPVHPNPQRNGHQRGWRPRNTPPRQDSSYFSEEGNEPLSARLQATPSQHMKPTSPPPLPPPPGSTSEELPIDHLAVLEIDENIQVQQIRARERVVIYRGRVRQTRDIIRHHRVELRQRQEDVRNIVERLARKITELVTLGRFEDISVQHETLRAAEDLLGPTEEEHEKLEIQLEIEERELEAEEEILYQQYDAAVGLPASRLDEIISPSTPEPPVSEVGVQTSNPNGLIQDYLDKIEDVKRLREEMDELESDFTRFSVHADIRRRNSIHMSNEMSNFFNDFEEVRAHLLCSIHNLEDDIFDIRDKCLEDGLFGVEDYQYEAYSALYEDCMEPVYDTEDRSPLRLAARRGISRGPQSDDGNKQEYVNHWLLECIQESTIQMLMLKMEIYYHFSEFSELQNEYFDNDRWADITIEYWHRDGAGKSANLNFNASRLDQILGSPCADHDITISTAFTRRSASVLQDELGDLDIKHEFVDPSLGSDRSNAGKAGLELSSIPRRASI